MNNIMIVTLVMVTMYVDGQGVIAHHFRKFKHAPNFCMSVWYLYVCMSGKQAACMVPQYNILFAKWLAIACQLYMLEIVPNSFFLDNNCYKN